MKKLIPLIVVFFLIISCNKGTDILDVNSSYKGSWYGTKDSSNHSAWGERAVLNISSNSGLSFKSYNMAGDIVEEINGTATINGNVIKVKPPAIPYTFTVISPPSQINLNTTGGYHWTMTLKSQFDTYPYYKY